MPCRKPLTFARGLRLADEAFTNAPALIARLHQLAAGAELVFRPAYANRVRRPTGYAVAVHAATERGPLLGYVFADLDARDLRADLELAVAGPQRRAA